MSAEVPETRKARCAYTLSGVVSPSGVPAAPAAGEGEAVVGDGGLTVGPVSVDFLDADGFTAADWAVTLDLWPSGRLRLSQLARRFETFAAALSAERDQTRVGGLLAHGVERPGAFDGVLLAPNLGPARFLVYATHLTAVPRAGDPFQVPFGAVEAITHEPDAWAVRIGCCGETLLAGKLARQTEPFFRALSKARDAQAARLEELSGSRLFADGEGVPVTALPDLERLLPAFSAPEREAGARLLLARAGPAKTRLGLVELLDPDGEGLAARQEMPRNTAAFLLASFGSRVVLEVLSGPSAATYVFEGDVEAINRDLQALHFRRRPLSFTEGEVKGAPGRPYRLAFRKLEPLKRLRAALRARVIHVEDPKTWEAGVMRAIG